MDPAYYLSACLPIGGFMEQSNLKYLLFSTGGKQQYMAFRWLNRRVIINLRSNSRAGQVYAELKSIIDKQTAATYKRGTHATTH
jgi:hypothetical protein